MYGGKANKEWLLSQMRITQLVHEESFIFIFIRPSSSKELCFTYLAIQGVRFLLFQGISALYADSFNMGPFTWI